MKQGIFTIESNAALTDSVYRMVLSGDTSAITAPGQFVNIQLSGKFLRRPISVCDYDEKTLTIVYKVVGKGTAQMAAMQAGETLDILTGLGNGYDLSLTGDAPVLLGGGVGVPPMYNLAKKLLAQGKKVTVILGFNTKSEIFYEQEFRDLGCTVTVTTVDGHAEGGDFMGSLSVNLCGIELSNPVIPASGTFGYGYEYAELYDINELGTFSFKGTTKDARFGNPTPRIAECTAGMINAVGLQNPGVEAVIARELPKLKKVFHKPVMANVSGFSVADYAYTCEKLDKEPQVGWLEVNVSCPNVHGGGMSFGTCPEAAAEVTRAVKAVTKKPVIIKLSPNVTDIVSIAKACEEAGADGISLINTMLGMRINLRTRRPVIANTMGGFSGPAIFPVAVRMVYQVAKAVKIPVVGMGGVQSAEDVIEMMLAGATAVEVGAANLVNPFASRDIVRALPETMAKYGIENLSEIIGGVK